jgi:hypothetical protein
MISKVKDVMNNGNNKQLAYKVWLDELKTTPSEAFFPTLKQYLELLIKENPAKIKVLSSKIKRDIKRMAHHRNKAIKELEELLKQIKIEAKKEKIQSLPEIDKYEQIKKGEIRTTEALPDSLYHAIRLTIEKYWSEDKFKKFKNLMGVNDNIWYFDYDKVSKKYPSYKQFKDIEDVQNDEYKNEPWGAFRYLLFVLSFFKKVTPEQAGSFVKPEIISCLNRFVLYLITPEDFEDQAKNQEIQYSFDKKRAVLKVKDKEIPFKKETRKIEFLTLLAKSPKYVYFSEVAEELDGASQEALKDAKNTYYEVCRGIEARLLKKGVSDFLDYNFNRARINPRYKRTSS